MKCSRSYLGTIYEQLILKRKDVKGWRVYQHQTQRSKVWEPLWSKTLKSSWGSSIFQPFYLSSLHRLQKYTNTTRMLTGECIQTETCLELVFSSLDLGHLQVIKLLWLHCDYMPHETTAINHFKSAINHQPSMIYFHTI